MFKNELLKLLKTINQSSPHFIRCIKPNDVQRPNKFDAVLINEQLRYSGVQDVVNIRQQGYPYRVEHKLFYQRYKMLSFSKQEAEKMQEFDDSVYRKICQDFCQRLDMGDGIAVGKTKVLYRSNAHDILETRRKTKINWAIAKIQNRYRINQATVRVHALQSIRKKVVIAISSRDLDTLTLALKEAEASQLNNFQKKHAESIIERLIIEKQLKKRLHDVLHQTEFSFDRGQKILNECDEEKFESSLVNSLKLRFIHEKVRDVLRKALSSQHEKELTVAIDQAVEAGMNLEDEENFPFLVRAFRLRLRLRTQGEVEESLRTAVKSKNRLQVKSALKGAHNIDLPTDNEAHAECLELARQLDDSEVELTKAVNNRDYEAIILALNTERELQQNDSEPAQRAKKLLSTLTPLNSALQKAMVSSDFNSVLYAVENADKNQMTCLCLHQARAFLTNHVVVSLKSAIQSSCLPGADWETLLTAALQKANILDMENHELAVECIQLKKNLKFVQVVRDELNKKNISGLKNALNDAAAAGIDDEKWSELTLAKDYVDKVESITLLLTEAIESKNPDMLEPAIKKAEQADIPESFLQEPRTIHEQLSKVVISLEEAIQQGVKDKVSSILSRANEIELAWEHSTYVKAREFVQSMSSFEEKLQAAVDARRLEELKRVLDGGGELLNTMEDKSLVNEANTLLQKMHVHNRTLGEGLKTQNFNEIVKAMNEANTADISCTNLERATKWANEYVRLALKSAINQSRIGTEVTPDWNQKLSDALDCASQLDMGDTSLAIEASHLRNKLSITEGLKIALENKDEAQIDSYLIQAQELKLSEDLPEITRAKKFQFDIETARNLLIEAVQSRNPQRMERAIQTFKVLLPVEGSNPLLTETVNTLAEYKKVVLHLSSAFESLEVQQLEYAIAEAKDFHLADEVRCYVKAREMHTSLSSFHKQLDIAMNERHYENLEAALARAKELNLLKKIPVVMDAQTLFTALGKANVGLTEAIASGDIRKMDDALIAANDVGFKGRCFEQVTQRVRLETVRELEQEIKNLKPDGDTKPLELVFARAQNRNINDEKLFQQAATLLTKTKDQQAALESLKDAIQRKDEQALDKALELAKDADIPQFLPVMISAVRYKDQLNDTRQKLRKAVESRDIDVLLPAVQNADELGLDKTLAVWKEAKLLQPGLQEVTEALTSAVEKGDVTALNLALTKADEMKMAEHATALTQAKLYQTQVIELHNLVNEASTKRRYTTLSQVLKRADELRQKDDAKIIDCQSLHAKLKKLDDAIRVAFANNDAPALDEAIVNAQIADCETRALTQALFRVGEDIRMELAQVIKAIKSGKKGKKNHQKLNKNVARSEKLKINDDDGIFVTAREIKNGLDHEEKVADQLRDAFLKKDEENIRRGVKDLEKLDPIEDNLELLNECIEYLDRLPTKSSLSKKAKHPLAFGSRTGYMDKRGQGFPHNWKTRFFALDQDLIKYYESAQSRQPKGSLMVSSIEILDATAVKGRKKKKGDAPFVLCGNTRQIQCAAKNESEREKWLNAVNNNLSIRRKLDRLQMIFESVSPKDQVNIYQLSVIAKLAYCPSSDEKTKIIIEIERNYPNGKVKLKECDSLVRSINPIEPQETDEAWRTAIQKYWRILIGKNAQTTSCMEDAQLLAFALFIPPKEVLDQFRKYFREKDRGKVTYLSFVYGLQKMENYNLCMKIHLDCDVPRCTLESKGLRRKNLSSAMFVNRQIKKTTNEKKGPGGTPGGRYI